MIQLKGNQRFFTAMFLVAFLMAAEVFGEEQIHRADLSVKASKRKDEKVTKTSDGILTMRIKSDTVTLEIEVGNRSKEGDTYTIVWAALAKSLTGGSEKTEQVVSEWGKKTITLDAAEVYTNSVNLTFVFTETNLNKTEYSSQTKGGDTYLGYIVLVMAGDEVIAEESSSSRFLKDDWIEKVKKAAKVKTAPGTK